MIKLNFKKYAILSLLGIVAITSRAATDKYRVMFREDPAYTMVIGWNQVSGSAATVYYDVVDHGTDVNKYAFSKTVDRTATYRAMNNTFARLSGLTPKTKYYFIIVDQNSTSPRMWFETLPDNKFERLSIVAGGDSRNNRLPRQRANRMVAKLRPHFVMFGGDMIDVDNDAQWNEWMEDWQLTKAADGRMTPVLMTRGNHESADRTVIDLFDIPTNNNAAYYAISVCDNLLRVYTLNTEISRTGDQYTWLKQDAASKGREAVWRYGQYHRPIIPHQSSKSILTDAIGTWSQTFYDEKFQLIIDSDAHMVKQTYPIRPSTESGSEKGHIRDDENGTIYMGEGCWGAPLRAADRINTWTQASGSFNSFNLIYVDYFKTEVRTINVDNEANVGTLTDAERFTLPANINVFTPATGAVVTIENKNASKPDVRFLNLPNAYIAATEGEFEVHFTAVDALLGVEKVFVYVNGQLQEEWQPAADDTAFSFVVTTANFSSYIIEVLAVNSRGVSTSVSRFFSVGKGNIQGVLLHAEDQAMEVLNVTFNTYTTSVSLQSIELGKVGDNSPVTGLRFSNMFIPSSAFIREAKLEFTAIATANRIVDLQIRLEMNASSEAFESGAAIGTGNIQKRVLTQSSVLWRPTHWQQGQTYTTPDLSTLINELRAHPEYVETSPITFVITSSGNGLRSAASFAAGQEVAPKLIIDYDFNPKPTQFITICEGNTASLSVGNGMWKSIEWSHDASIVSTSTEVSTSGLYRAVVEDSLGYKGWVDFNVLVSVLPSVNLGGDAQLVDKTSHVLDAGEHAHYLWSTGETTRQITVTKNGVYSVEVSNESGCKSTDEVNVSFTQSTSVALPVSQNLRVYPNPLTGNELFISHNGFNGVYAFYSIDGKKVLAGTLNGVSVIDVSSLSSGAYMLSLLDESGNETIYKVLK